MRVRGSIGISVESFVKVSVSTPTLRGFQSFWGASGVKVRHFTTIV